MKFSISILLGSLAFSLATPSTRYAIHQKRDEGTASQWIKRDVKLNQRSIIPISIALSQRNLHKGEEFLMDVSDPSSPNYGKHWSPEKVGNSTQKKSQFLTRNSLWKPSLLQKPRLTPSNHGSQTSASLKKGSHCPSVATGSA